MLKDNLEMRPYYTDTGVRALMAAICLQAIRDYKSGTILERDEIRPFFSSSMFDFFTNGQSEREIVASIEKVPSNVMHMCFVADVPKLYVSESAKIRKDARYTVYKDGQFLAGYSTIRSARILAERENADLYENGKFIYSPNIDHIKGGLKNGRKAKSVQT